MCSHFFICHSAAATHLSPRCYLFSKHCLLFSTSTNYLPLFFYFKPQHTNYNLSKLYSLWGECRKYKAPIPTWQLLSWRHMLLLHMPVSSPLLKQASFHSPEAESKEAVKSQHQKSSAPASLTRSDRPRSSCPH